MGEETDRQMNKLASRLAVKYDEVGGGRCGVHLGEWAGLVGLVSCLSRLSAAAKAASRSTSVPKAQTVILSADFDPLPLTGLDPGREACR